MSLLVILVELILLYRLSVVVHGYVFYILRRVFRNKHIALWLYSVIFLPGTLIHELSHYLFAIVLFVPVGEIKLLPEYTDGGIRLGEVRIAKSDPIRRFLIGIAPLVVGIFILFTLLYFASHNDLYKDWKAIFMIGYITFVVGNTMFSSKKDMEEAWKFFVIIAAMILTGIILKLPLDFNVLNQTLLNKITQNALLLLLIPLGLDVVIIYIMRVIRR